MPAAKAAAYAAEQAAGAPKPVADALRSLPMLGTNRSGPLGHGRLSNGHVGQAIRELQAVLTARVTT